MVMVMVIIIIIIVVIITILIVRNTIHIIIAMAGRAAGGPHCVGRHCLSKTTCLIRPHSFSTALLA